MNVTLYALWKLLGGSFWLCIRAQIPRHVFHQTWIVLWEYDRIDTTGMPFGRNERPQINALDAACLHIRGRRRNPIVNAVNYSRSIWFVKSHIWWRALNVRIIQITTSLPRSLPLHNKTYLQQFAHLQPRRIAGLYRCGRIKVGYLIHGCRCCLACGTSFLDHEIWVSHIDHSL